jgi:hypothetical protein
MADESAQQHITGLPRQRGDANFLAEHRSELAAPVARQRDRVYTLQDWAIAAELNHSQHLGHARRFINTEKPPTSPVRVAHAATEVDTLCHHAGVGVSGSSLIEAAANLQSLAQ